ncbi:hypothetical protein [Streptomyces yokosukanensis]|uniref:hypothetical protein n=1 Tax=Streptomyces yokosukanensis TaxID=67386 RepID=UPI00082FE9A3|nr:hypothetical protein [Streptomyces yokosukanensis]
MLMHEAVFTVDLGEDGYIIGFAEHDGYPAQMPYGWRCGPVDDSSIVVMTTTDTGPLQMRVQVHDSRPEPETGNQWEPAEEVSLLCDDAPVHLELLDPGDVTDTWPENEPAIRMPASPGTPQWVRMRMYCHADDYEPGIGDRGERHLIQLWPAPPADPVHPPISNEDRQARTEYTTAMARQTEEYVVEYTVHLTGHDLGDS